MLRKRQKNLLDRAKGGAPTVAGIRRWSQHSTSQSHRRRLLQRAAGVSRRLRPRWTATGVASHGVAAGRLAGERRAAVWHSTAGCRRRHRVRLGRGERAVNKTLTGRLSPFQTGYGGPHRSELTAVDGVEMHLPRHPYSWVPTVRFTVNRPENANQCTLQKTYEKGVIFCDSNVKS
jgi:hypothetical protein